MLFRPLFLTLGQHLFRMLAEATELILVPLSLEHLYAPILFSLWIQLKVVVSTGNLRQSCFLLIT